jgi:PKD repeat protein
MPSFASPLPYQPNRAAFWQDSFYYLDVSGLPVKADSAAITGAMAAFHAPDTAIAFRPFGQSSWNGGNAAGYFVDSLPAGTDPNTARRTWAANQPQAQQAGKHLYFSDLRQQGATRNILGQYSTVGFGDRHAILYNEPTNELMECIGYSGYSAACMHNVTWDLSSYDMPMATNGTTPAGAIAPRFPVAPLFFTYQDLLNCGSSGDLGHMVGFVLRDYRNQKQWPSRGGDGTQSTGPKSGEVLRLRSDFNLASLPNDMMRALARTLMKYGAILFDRGDLTRVITCSDPRWTTAHRTSFPYDQFQCVDLSSVAGTTNSLRLSITNAGNEVPVPSFTHTPVGGAAPLTVSFNASATTDPDGTIASYSWNFGDGSTGTGVTTSHTYATAGSYTPTLTVIDNDGAAASVAASGWVPQYVLDTPPDKVRFGVSCDTGMKAKFEDPISKPLSMYRRFFSWAQATGGSMRSEVLANNTAGRSTWLSFKTPGTTTSWRDVAAGNYQAQVDAFLVGLRDTGINTWLTPYHEPEENCTAEAPANGRELSGTAAEWRAMIRYVEARRKVVNASNVLIVPVLMASTFNSGTRDDADWVLLDADFPLYGIDPYTNDWASGPARLTSASFTAAVSALEAYGKDIAIAECGGAIGTSTARPVGLWAGFVQECLDHDIKACCWFDVGTNDKLNASPADPSGTTYAAVLATFAGSSNYNLGRAASSSPAPGTISVTGAPPPANVAPTAIATSVASSGLAPFATSFASSGSSDSDGTIVSRLWNFGDGTTSTATNPSKTYTVPGTYTVTLTVTDDDGATRTSTLVITVVRHRPTAVATADISSGVAPLTVSFDATGSTDSQGYRITGYAWNFGDGTTGTGPAVTHTYTSSGTYTVTLTAVSDDTA